MKTAFYYQVYFRNDPHICIVLVGLCRSDDEIISPVAPIERDKEKIVKRYGTKDFRIEEATLESILGQLVFMEDIVELVVLRGK